MEFTRKAEVTIEGYTFEVREMTIAVKEQIDQAREAGGADVVRETIKRCVYYEGKPLGDDVGDMGYSFVTPLILKIQELSGAENPAVIASDAAAAVGKAATTGPTPGPAANGHAPAAAVAPGANAHGIGPDTDGDSLAPKG